MKNKLLFFSLFFLLLVGTGWLSTRASFLKVSNFSVVSGNDTLDSLVRKKLLIYLGQSMFKISTHDILLELKNIPEIASLEVARRWPSTIHVNIFQRSVVFRWQKDPQNKVRDGKGVLFEPSVESKQLPLLEGDASERILQNVGEFLEKNEQELNAYGLANLKWNSQNGLSLLPLGEGPVVELGFEQFDHAWLQAHYFLKRAEGLLSLKDLSKVDAAYKQRVIVAFSNKLKIYENSLNLKEIVRRKAL